MCHYLWSDHATVILQQLCLLYSTVKSLLMYKTVKSSKHTSSLATFYLVSFQWKGGWKVDHWWGLSYLEQFFFSFHFCRALSEQQLPVITLLLLTLSSLMVLDIWSAFVYLFPSLITLSTLICSCYSHQWQWQLAAYHLFDCTIVVPVRPLGRRL